MKRLIVLPLLAAVAAAALAARVQATSSHDLQLTNVTSANTRAPGYAPASVLSGEVHQTIVAQGAMALDGADGIVTNYGYENDVPAAGSPSTPQMLPTTASPTEAQKTEPDKNTYLVFKDGLHGPDDAYDYGKHFLFQGHELGADLGTAGSQGYLTRINLDADIAHRVTLLATKDTDGNPIQPIDGSTWDPWAKRLLLTTEDPSAPTYAATPDYPSSVADVSGALGRGGYEGIQDDSAGNIWIVEDSSGAVKSGTAKRPNSFIFRFVPKTPGDLANGKLQVLQVLNKSGDPITFESQASLNASDQVDLHTYGKSFKTKWVTVHDTAVDGTAPFSANTAAKAAHGTPFKRPENGVFRPGTDFGEFYFTETGDTSISSPENANGGWGSVFKLTQLDPSDDNGKLTVFFKGDKAHTGLDNIAFLSQDQFSAVEDAGAGLHTDRNALDSGWVFDASLDYSKAKNRPVRWLAEGRDASATLDAANGGFGKNEDDNEITGIHVSDGDTTVDGVLGAKVPKLDKPNTKWRWFYTAQHGDNDTFEVVYDGPRLDSEDD